MQSAAKGELEQDELNPQSEEEQAQQEKKAAEDKKTYETLLKSIETGLADKVKEVRLSQRLTESPACLVRDQHAMGPQMERLLKATGQPFEKCHLPSVTPPPVAFLLLI